MASIYWATKTVSYGPFNAPCITQGNKFSTLVYGPNQERIKHSDSNGRVTKYVGGIYEEVTKAGVTQKIHYVGDFALVTQTGGVTPVIKHEYLHRDHIGSIVAISKSTVASANDVQWQSNGAWGERRYQQWNGPLDNLLNPDSTAKGFTDHEHLDAVGLIHMNGRVYDPELGRFMSADPFVQAPYNSQSYNRYSYVFNNPLSFTDPTGYFGQGSGCDDQGCITYPSGGCASGASCMTGDSAWQFIQQWSASENRGEQWSYQGGAAYNIADFWGKVAFDLAAGSNDSQDANANDGTTFDMSKAAFWMGAAGFGFEQSKGYVGVHRANYLTDWRFYKMGWTGNGYVNTSALAGWGKNLGVFGFMLGTIVDVDKVSRVAPADVKRTTLSAALNLGAGIAAYAHPKRFGIFGIATGLNDAYGRDIAAGVFQGAMAISPNVPHPKPESNDLDRALEQAFVRGSR